MVHIYQLGVKAALEVITPSTMKLRKTLHTIRINKVCRAFFRKYSKSMHGVAQEPPCLDVITRWNSTLTMYQQGIKLKDILTCTISDNLIDHEFADHILSVEDWNHIQNMEQWLSVPYIICNYLSGSKYPTLLVATPAFKHFLSHCNGYLEKKLEEVQSPLKKATLSIQQKASDKCLQYLNQISRIFEVHPISLPCSLIQGMFLDIIYWVYFLFSNF